MNQSLASELSRFKHLRTFSISSPKTPGYSATLIEEQARLERQQLESVAKDHPLQFARLRQGGQWTKKDGKWEHASHLYGAATR